MTKISDISLFILQSGKQCKTLILGFIILLFTLLFALNYCISNSGFTQSFTILINPLTPDNVLRQEQHTYKTSTATSPIKKILPRYTNLTTAVNGCIYSLPDDWYTHLSLPKEVPRQSYSRIPTQFFGYTSDAPYGYVQNDCYLNINTDFCNQLSLQTTIHERNRTVVIAMLSTVTNLHVRDAIRKTFGSIAYVKNTRFRYVFFIGHTAGNKELQKKVDEEAQKYGDIVQENISDSYENLAVKCMAAFKWFSYFCQSATYFVRATDDLFINPFVVENLLQSCPLTSFSSGSILGASPIINDKSHKWGYKIAGPVDIPWSGLYAPYYSGVFAIFSADIARNMYMMSRRTPLFFPDDCYIGVLLEKLGLSVNDRIVGSPGVKTVAFYHFYANDRLYQQIIDMWNELLRS